MPGGATHQLLIPKLNKATQWSGSNFRNKLVQQIDICKGEENNECKYESEQASKEMRGMVDVTGLLLIEIIRDGNINKTKQKGGHKQRNKNNAHVTHRVNEHIGKHYR